jgi:hypothetical protein
VLPCVFWDKNGILLVVYLEKSAIITSKVLRCISWQTEAAAGLQTSWQALKGILFLQDIAAPHKAAITHQKCADLHFEVMKHLVFSPDFDPLDYYLFPNLKKHLKWKTFWNISEATFAVDRWFAIEPKEFFLDML